jgi:2-polyprenyl-6-hydroxyphenyl methylase/3-demethylubiquinone-9 3-methyltransferase
MVRAVTSGAVVESRSGDATTEPRFEFGQNWARFLSVLSVERIAAAEESLQRSLACGDLVGRRFLDVGSGSGLFSLAARRLGARVCSFDQDPQSVACTRELRCRYCPGDPGWTIERGSVLDEAFMAGLGTFDVIYAWGVLHHTGDLWRALDIVTRRVGPGGALLVSLYNDCGRRSSRWARIKRLYGRLPRPLRGPYALAMSVPSQLAALARAVAAGETRAYVDSWRRAGRDRGMSRWHDIVDWVGGYPYEVARVDRVFSFVRDRGLNLVGLRLGGGLGCSEYVFERPVQAPPDGPAGASGVSPRPTPTLP